jgi:hypothetical protein
MTNKAFLSYEQIEAVIFQAKSDRLIWERLKEIELDIEREYSDVNEDFIRRNQIGNEETRKESISSIIKTLVESVCGCDYYYPSAIVPLRRALRIELELPI